MRKSCIPDSDHRVGQRDRSKVFAVRKRVAADLFQSFRQRYSCQTTGPGKRVFGDSFYTVGNGHMLIRACIPAQYASDDYKAILIRRQAAVKKCVIADFCLFCGLRDLRQRFAALKRGIPDPFHALGETDAH